MSLGGLSFFWKYSEMNLTLENVKKKSGNILGCWDNCIRKCCDKLSLLRTEYLLSAVNGLTNSPKILYITQRDFINPNSPQGSINMVKLLPFRFQQCFGAFTMLLVDGSSETGLFIHLTKHVFWSPSVQKYIS